VVEELGQRGLLLPFSSLMPEEEVVIMCEVLGKVLV
jgi:hypothetical protein